MIILANTLYSKEDSPEEWQTVMDTYADLSFEYFDQLIDDDNDGKYTPFHDMVYKALSDLRENSPNVALGINSNSGKILIYRVIEKLDIQQFFENDLILSTSNRQGLPKTEDKSYELVKRHFALEEDQEIPPLYMIEDSPKNLPPATRQGFNSVLINNTGDVHGRIKNAKAANPDFDFDALIERHPDIASFAESFLKKEAAPNR